MLIFASCRADSGADGPVEPRSMTAAEVAPDGEHLPEALEATGSASSEIRAEGAHALEQLSDPQAIPALEALLADEDRRVQCVAAEALGSFGAEARSAADQLVAMLQSGGPELRRCSAAALAFIGGETALEALLAHLDTSTPGELRDTVVALGRLGRVEAAPRLVGYLESPDGAIVAETTEALERIGPGALSAVRPLLDSDSGDARCAVASLLARWESVADQARLSRMSRYDSDPVVRICLLGALGRMGDLEAVAQLAERLTSPESELRVQAAEALGVTATPPAVQALIRALTAFHSDDQPNAAQTALLTIGHSAVPALREALPSGPPLRRALVAETLGLMGDRSALDSLEQAVMDTDQMVRQAASAALAALRDASR